MYDEEGEQVWEHSLDLNGKVINGSNAPCPFLYQGQYYDKEIELAYNRFRYYDPDDGRYISKDPIGLLSGEYGFYNYVGDSNSWVDPFGLKSKTYGKYDSKDKAAKAVLKNANRRSIKKNKEFGGFIYKKDGKYHATRPTEGSATGYMPKSSLHKVPKDAEIVGDYHTHGAEMPGYDSNNFSPADKRIHSMAPSGHTSYLGTPSEGFKQMTNGIITKL
ncbi:DUF4329 domain-containing protein [Tenacibaculum maritimum]|uniref:DUF4329 domain-containing protein n=2 Tax=Tenacibaculum maritimum TaxID=107401 RepID=UPI003877401B